MGSGSKPRRDVNVPKRSKKLVGAEVGSNPIGHARPSRDMCIVSFNANLITTSLQVTNDEKLYLAPSERKDQMLVLYKEKQVGVYSGVNSALLWSCSNEGYRYVAVVLDSSSHDGQTHIKARIDTYQHE